MIHVPYRGEAPAIADVMGGQVPVLFANIPSGMPYVNSGKLKALVTTGATRSPQAKDVPTMIESGVVKVQTATWNALYGPAGDRTSGAEGQSGSVRVDRGGGRLIKNKQKDPTSKR